MASINDNLFTTLVEHAQPRELGCFLLTRFGWVRARFTSRGLAELVFEERPAGASGTSDSVFRKAFLSWLAAYQQADASEQWSYLDLEGTDFQKAVWRALVQIPFGTRTSYGQIARALEKPKASRAVGSAVGANPISLIVPCHRVLPSSGKSGHYRWGADRKLALLEAEQEPASNLCALFR